VSSLLDDLRRLPREQRLAGAAAVALIVSMVLPWYDSARTLPVIVNGHAQAATANATHSALSVFTFVEAALLLTAIAVLVLLASRAQRRAFHLPGGDGTIITVAGGWALLLVVWRFFDKPGFGANTTVGLHWGVLGPLAAALLLAWAGQRMRAAHRPEPDNPTAVVPPGDPVTAATEVTPRAARGRLRRARPDDDEQLTIPLAPERSPERPSLLDDDLTRPHGSEPPLPRDDLTLELGEEPSPRRQP
jgi:hypothetical protein